jgi:hypothetical protein
MRRCDNKTRRKEERKGREGHSQHTALQGTYKDVSFSDPNIKTNKTVQTVNNPY